MNRIDEHMGRIKEAGKKALVTFLTAGDPNIEVTKKAIRVMQDEGADLIEIGVPFSDPAADGPVIQEADARAIAAGTDIRKVFDMAEEIRSEIRIPMVFLLYFNIIVQYGIEEFFKKCAEVGIDGLVIPDLPYEEHGDIKEYTDKYGVYQIFLVSPTSRDRIKTIASNAKGFLYCVSSLGVTGEKAEFHTNFSKFFDTINKYTNVPACIGFGISNGKQAKELSAYCDGAIIGSALVKAIAVGKTDEERTDNLRAKLRDLRSGLDS